MRNGIKVCDDVCSNNGSVAAFLYAWSVQSLAMENNIQVLCRLFSLYLAHIEELILHLPYRCDAMQK